VVAAAGKLGRDALAPLHAIAADPVPIAQGLDPRDEAVDILVVVEESERAAHGARGRGWLGGVAPLCGQEAVDVDVRAKATVANRNGVFFAEHGGGELVGDPFDVEAQYAESRGRILRAVDRDAAQTQEAVEGALGQGELVLADPL